MLVIFVNIQQSQLNKGQVWNFSHTNQLYLLSDLFIMLHNHHLNAMLVIIIVF